MHHTPTTTSPSPAGEPNPEQIFTRKYRRNHWGSIETVSGRGSELRQTVEVRAAVTEVVDRYAIRSVTDAGCGDLNWQQHVAALSHVNYLGIDVVAELIDHNRQRYGNPRRHFQHRDVTLDPLPYADLVICRDCLVHLSNIQILVALQHIAASRSRYLLATTYPAEQINRDTRDGGWRPVNLTAPPFCLPAPIEFFDTDYRDNGRNHPGNGLGLWPVEAIPALDTTAPSTRRTT